MLKNLKLSTKVFALVIPLFAASFAVIVYLNYRFEESQTLELARSAADAQANLIKKSLVHMMTTRFEVDDKYLNQISRPGELENVRVLFRLDSLQLDAEYLKPERVPILRAREAGFRHVWNSEIDHVFTTGDSLWVIKCDTTKHAAVEKHQDFQVTSFSSGIPMSFWKCARLKIVLPFQAESRCQQCHDVPDARVLGAASMEIPLSQAMSAIRANAIRSFGIFLALTVVVTAAGAFVFRRVVARPINRLVHAAQVIGSGDLDHELVEEFGRDELGKLAASFEEMQEKLKAAQSELIQKERLSAIGQMASGIVHDFRNPMTNISLGLALLQSSPLTDDRRRDLYKEMQEAIQRMARMTQELLDFSRGEIQLEKKPVEVSTVIAELVSSIEGHLNERNIKVGVSVDSHRVCYMDKNRLQRALINIINNAEDALPHGGEVHLGVHEEDESVVFTIRDTGAGVPDHIRLRLFEPFVTTGKKSGTGLGLAITKRLVEQHGGRVEFESALGKGTVFYVKIPVNDSPLSQNNSGIDSSPRA